MQNYAKDPDAIAKLCAWREEDQAWPREAFRAEVAKRPETQILLDGELLEAAPGRDERLRRLRLVSADPPAP